MKKVRKRSYKLVAVAAIVTVTIISIARRLPLPSQEDTEPQQNKTGVQMRLEEQKEKGRWAQEHSEGPNPGAERQKEPTTEPEQQREAIARQERQKALNSPPKPTSEAGKPSLIIPPKNRMPSTGDHTVALYS